MKLSLEQPTHTCMSYKANTMLANALVTLGASASAGIDPPKWEYSVCSIRIVNGFSQLFNSLWPSDIIWLQGSRSTLAQVMACCLMAPSHFLNQC